jgi:hypothetical protein
MQGHCGKGTSEIADQRPKGAAQRPQTDSSLQHNGESPERPRPEVWGLALAGGLPRTWGRWQPPKEQDQGLCVLSLAYLWQPPAPASVSLICGARTYVWHKHRDTHTYTCTHTPYSSPRLGI